MKGETARLTYEPLTRASARTGVSIQDLQRYIAVGQLNAYRCGPRIIRVNPREVDMLRTRACCISGNEHLDKVDGSDPSVAVRDSLRIPMGNDLGVRPLLQGCAGGADE